MDRHIRQAFWLARSNVMGTVAARPAAVVVVLLSVCGSVLVFDGICAMLVGMSRLLENGARADRAVLLHPMAVEESDSMLNESSALDVVGSIDEVAEASPELVGAWIHLRDTAEDDDTSPVALRGVMPAAFDLRPDMKVVAGRPFVPGRLEVMAGVKAAQEFEGLAISAHIPVNGFDCEVVGTFETGGAHDFEVWADLRVVQQLVGRWGAVSSARLRLRDAAELAELRAEIEEDPRMAAVVTSELEFARASSAEARRTLTVLAAVLSAIMAVGTVAASFNAAHASVQSRMREIATVRAIGFPRSVVSLSLVMENILYAVVGGLCATLLAGLALHGVSATARSGTSDPHTMVFDMAVTPGVAALGMTFALAVGVIGTLVPVYATRIPLAAAQRRK